MQHYVEPGCLAVTFECIKRHCMFPSVSAGVCLLACLSVSLSVYVCVAVNGAAMSLNTCSATTVMQPTSTHLHAMSMNCQSSKMCMCKCIASAQPACMQDHVEKPSVIQDVYVYQMLLICTASMHARQCSLA